MRRFFFFFFLNTRSFETEFWVRFGQRRRREPVNGSVGAAGKIIKNLGPRGGGNFPLGGRRDDGTEPRALGARALRASPVNSDSPRLDNGIVSSVVCTNEK